MTRHLSRVLLAPMMLLFAVCTASAADGCGTGCHATVSGACVVDGWATGARVWNQCPTTSRSRPPCGGSDYVWDSRKRACFPSTRDWL
ncbi:hypothetical protein ABIF65_004052 [Bradyrhizobium japonicum]|jgi:hypothetical protein|uniref:GCG_CRPN prefix-to-repeats domain-containing protein n=2 Tax=Bradyrhizobium TaxID=374 RepID=UPI000A2F45C8|nr:hypothetical protein [Bradyrhizobium japonicum]MCP1779266.1 hypothetical protein [Bradyrhizobium japonicum]MCP1858632.1 hypothetical protein [Bradyrhizobium japonicum]MCP1889451.1 hypothetical protein [Bradyrhizobium japonicum]MCP1957738.1 hypothetical protein [Bradyrhizobium japonicum]